MKGESGAFSPRGLQKGSLGPVTLLGVEAIIVMFQNMPLKSKKLISLGRLDRAIIQAFRRQKTGSQF